MLDQPIYVKLSLVGVSISNEHVTLKLSKKEEVKVAMADISGISLVKGKKSYSWIDIITVFSDNDPSRSSAPSDSYKLTIHLTNGDNHFIFVQDFDLAGLSREIKAFNDQLNH